MKIVVMIFSLFVLLISCQDGVINKPDRLIERDKMVDIIYDLALLDGIKSRDPLNLQGVSPNEFVYKKYKIDSLQFAKSNQYYASDIRKYKKIYEEVGVRIENNKAYVDTLISKEKKKTTLSTKPEVPTVK